MLQLKIWKRIFKEEQQNFDSDIQKEFINSLNAYISDNYSTKDIKTIQNYKSKIGVDKESNLTLYRGLFFNNLFFEQKTKLLNQKFIEDNNMSYTRNLEEAIAFATGSNIYSKNKKIKLFPNQLGIIIKVPFSLNEIIADFKYILENDSYPELDVIEENEVIVKKKKRLCKISHFIVNNKILPQN